jgi:hypothetical protein
LRMGAGRRPAGLQSAGEQQNPNPAKGNPSRTEQIQNPAKGNPNSKPRISFAESSLIKNLRGPLAFFAAPRRTHRKPLRQGRQGERGIRRRFGPRFAVLRFLEASEGLAPFTDRGWGPLRDARAHFRPTLRPRSLMARKQRGTVASTGIKARGSLGKTGRSIRRPAKVRPLETSPNRFRA